MLRHLLIFGLLGLASSYTENERTTSCDTIVTVPSSLQSFLGDGEHRCELATTYELCFNDALPPACNACCGKETDNQIGSLSSAESGPDGDSEISEGEKRTSCETIVPIPPQYPLLLRLFLFLRNKLFCYAKQRGLLDQNEA